MTEGEKNTARCCYLPESKWGLLIIDVGNLIFAHLPHFGHSCSAPPPAAATIQTNRPFGAPPHNGNLRRHVLTRLAARRSAENTQRQSGTSGCHDEIRLIIRHGTCHLRVSHCAGADDEHSSQSYWARQGGIRLFLSSQRGAFWLEKYPLV